LRRGQERFRRLFPGKSNGTAGLGLAAAVVLLLWAANGIYRVGPDEQGVVLRFGKFIEVTEPGLHYRLPAPIGTSFTPKVTSENVVQIGFRSLGDQRERGTQKREVPEESQVLTGDENIVSIDASVVWDIKDAPSYLFNLRDQDGTVRVAAESVLREVIGQKLIQVVMTEGRGAIEEHIRTRLQSLLDEYQAGIRVKRVQLLAVDPPTDVVDAFNNVQRAKADRERLRNEAEAHRNSVIPIARGNAERLLQEAQAYREEIVNRAKGDSKRFLSVLGVYDQAKDVTRGRMYLETMEGVLHNSGKVLIDRSAQGVVPYLPLPEVKARRGAQIPEVSAAPQSGEQSKGAPQ
ncbi:MAG: FtsH protease activity modulator HflK, partial [Alphaproteobacteria bacterium]|nr:FtsH protease activity modulator HflK [Alphaproteobacteria bacterium]